MSELLPSKTTSFYKPDSEYAAPMYSPSGDTLLARSGAISKKYYKDEFSPRDALIRWNESSPGGWQRDQAARYPTFHRDLDPDLLPPEYDTEEKATEFRKELLRLFTHEPIRYDIDSAHQDFHPIGHMSRVLVMLDNLSTDGPLVAQGYDDPFLLSVIRHAAALHDIGETEHPGGVIKHGRVVGDIASDVGKTIDDRTQERAIYESVLGEVFGDVYSPESREAMIKIVSHEIEGESEQFTTYHGILEFAHHLNSAYTGQFVGERAAQLALAGDSHHANFMTVLAEQSGRVLTNKFEEVFGHSPHLQRLLGTTAHNALRELDVLAHCRDEDEEWLKWRASQKITDAYGEYTPETF
jgi:hypothetical protein